MLVLWRDICTIVKSETSATSVTSNMFKEHIIIHGKIVHMQQMRLKILLDTPENNNIWTPILGKIMSKKSLWYALAPIWGDIWQFIVYKCKIDSFSFFTNLKYEELFPIRRRDREGPFHWDFGWGAKEMEERVVHHQQHPLGMDFSPTVLLNGGLKIQYCAFPFPWPSQKTTIFWIY